MAVLILWNLARSVLVPRRFVPAKAHALNRRGSDATAARYG
jgi:hypothetical protein